MSKKKTPYIKLVDIGNKEGRYRDTYWTWEVYIDECHMMLANDIRACARYLLENNALLPSPLSGEPIELPVRKRKKAKKKSPRGRG